MTEPEDQDGEVLRRALHAAADDVVPSGDGLERIRYRIAQERSRDGFPLVIGWLKAVVIDLRHLLADIRSAMPAMPPVVATALRATVVALAAAFAACRAAAATAVGAARPVALTASRKTVDAGRSAVRSARPVVTSALSTLRSVVGERLREPDGWLRPVLATAGAVLVAIVAVLAIPAIRHNIIPSSNVTTPVKSGPSGSGSVFGNGTQSSPGTFQSQGTRTSPSAKATPTHKRSSGPQARCATSSPARTPCPSTSAAAPTSASPTTPTTPPPTTPPPTTPPPTPTPTPSGSSTQGTTGSDNESTSARGSSSG